MKRKETPIEQESSKTIKRRRRRSSCASARNDQAKPRNDVTRSYPYGNFQIDRWPDETRLSCFRKDWFENRDVLDVGCNTGFMTLAFALLYRPASIAGIDIDGHLINSARRNLAVYQQMAKDRRTHPRRNLEDQQRDGSDSEVFPASMTILYGPLFPPSLKIDGPSSSASSRLGFCKRVDFRVENFVLENDADLENVKGEYDTVTALNVTKWVHLQWGDDGLKRFFKRAYAQLRPGGYFVLEPQSWAAYKRELKRRTVNVQLDFKPDKFRDYLLSDEVGFSTCRVSAFEKHISKGFRRPILLFVKADST